MLREEFVAVAALVLGGRNRRTGVTIALKRQRSFCLG